MGHLELRVDLRRDITHIDLIRVLSPAFHLESKGLLKLNINLYTLGMTMNYGNSFIFV